jgi:DNA-binding HxlR family transcriptional regulator
VGEQRDNSKAGTDTLPVSGHDIWDRVTPILGKTYLAANSPERLAGFCRLVETAYRGGREATGPVREILALVGDRWSTLLLQLLRYGPLRFSIIQRIVSVLQEGGISRRMLTLKLRALERDGLVARAVTPTVPPSVSYQLTEMGADLWRMAAAMVDWIEAHHELIESSRRAFEQHEAVDDQSDDER